MHSKRASPTTGFVFTQTHSRLSASSRSSFTSSKSAICTPSSSSLLNHISLLPQIRSCATATHTQSSTATVSRESNALSNQGNIDLERAVIKFGGSSLADSSRLEEVADIIKYVIGKSKCYPVVVLSAMGPSTNELLAAGKKALEDGSIDVSTIRKRAYEACDKLGLNKEATGVEMLLNELDTLLLGVKFIRELSPRTLDYLVSFGERLSVRIMAEHLRINHNLPARHFDAFDIGFTTTSNFQNADLLDETYTNVANFFEKNISKEKNNVLPIVTGFIGKDKKNNITTLGRGGSDLTASAIGASIGATEVQVWKDVNGILSTDPRIVSEAIPVPFVTFEEASEMAFFGAKVLHPVAMWPAMWKNVPVRVKNSYNREHPGTLITKTREPNEKLPLTAISVKRNIQLVDITSTRMLGAYGFLAKVFSIFARHKISVDVIATSEVSISLTMDKQNKEDEIEVILSEELADCATVKFGYNKCIVSYVTSAPKSTNVLAKCMHALDDSGINVQMISQGASKYNVSLVVENDEGDKAVQALHRKFF